MLTDQFYCYPLRVLAVVRTLPNRNKAFCEHMLLQSIDRPGDHNLLPPGTDPMIVYLNDPGPLDTIKAQVVPALQDIFGEGRTVIVQPS